MKRVQGAVGVAAVALMVTAGMAMVQGQGSARTVWEGVYSAPQAERGLKVYMAQCASCHGAEMKAGAGAPSLSGPEFQFGWDKKTVGSLFEYVQSAMPPGGAGSLKDSEIADILAAILKTNGFPESASAELPAGKAALESVTLLATKP